LFCKARRTERTAVGSFGRQELGLFCNSGWPLGWVRLVVADWLCLAGMGAANSFSRMLFPKVSR